MIDERLDEQFPRHVPERECQTARYAGLCGLENGELLRAEEAAKFDVFITVDQGIEYQQNLQDRNIAIIILHVKSNRLKDLLTLLPDCLAHDKTIQPGQIVKIEA